MKALIEYLKQLKEEWVLITTGGVSASLLWLISFTSPDFKFPREYILGILFIFFCVAQYRVWRRIFTEEKDPFEVTFTAEKVVFEKSKFLKLNEEEDLINKSIKRFEGFRDQYKVLGIESNLDHFGTTDDWEKYRKEIQIYEKELTSFGLKLQNCFKINFWIKNSSPDYDDRIVATIKILPKNRTGKIELFESLNDVQKLPRRPERPTDRILSSLNDSMIPFSLGFTRSGHGSDPRRGISIFSWGSTQTTISELRAGECIECYISGAILKTTEENLSAEFEVMSRNLAKPFSKTIPILLGESLPVSSFGNKSAD